MRPAEETIFCVLVPFDRAEACSLKEAADRAGKSESTIRNWCVNYGIGRRVAGGVWQISKPALEMLLTAMLQRYVPTMLANAQARLCDRTLRGLG